jgi:hypothetical protein
MFQKNPEGQNSEAGDREILTFSKKQFKDIGIER